MYFWKRLGALALVAVVATGCSSSKKSSVLDKWSEQASDRIAGVVEDQVADTDRRELALAAVAELRSNDADFAREIAAIYQHQQDLNFEYDSPRAEFEATSRTFLELRNRYRTHLAEGLDTLKDSLSAEEWRLVWAAYEEEIVRLEGLYE